MTKKDIMDLIYEFESETWKYPENANLEMDIDQLYSAGKEANNYDESNLKILYDKLSAMIGMIRFKDGFESMVTKSNPELENLNKLIQSIPLNSDDIINQYNYVSTMYQNIINKTTNLDFIKNNYENKQGQEGLFLAIESLKSLITDSNYRKLLDENQIGDIIIDCMRLNNGLTNMHTLETKYKEFIDKIWEQSLDNSINNDNFRVLFSNISGGYLKEQANLLINRPHQSSCSMISSDFIATYGSNVRKIGFIYPNDSKIMMASAYDLCSNVLGDGMKNKEKGTLIATPKVMETIGIENSNQKGEDKYSSTSYNEILVDSKPCGITIIGLGENDLNIYYQEAQELSKEMNLPIYSIDTMNYKNNLSDADKEYIAFHSILSYLGISTKDVQQMYSDNNFSNIYRLIDTYKEQIAELFVTLKSNGNLSKENMHQAMRNIMDIENINDKTK